MKPEWVLVYSTDQMYKALFMKEKLFDENIEAVIVNKRDSLYAIGEIELYVPPEEAVKSIYFIKKQSFE